MKGYKQCINNIDRLSQIILMKSHKNCDIMFEISDLVFQLLGL